LKWEMKRVHPDIARQFNAKHHSRLPTAQRGPWKYAFAGYVDGDIVGSALWHNPSARGLNPDWIELRRMALSDKAPKNFATWMLARMIKWLKSDTTHTRAISYQDIRVHDGTIYRAGNWIPAYVSRPRNRDRSKPRNESGRMYRSDSNGAEPASSAKIRWEYSLIGEHIEPLTIEQIDNARKLKATN